MEDKWIGKTAIRFYADADEATRTITISREIWTHKGKASRGRDGSYGEWQRRCVKYVTKGEIRRATWEDLADMPCDPFAALAAFRAESRTWIDHYTKQAQARLEQAAEHRDQATWPTSRTESVSPWR